MIKKFQSDKGERLMMAIKPRQLHSLELQYIAAVRVARVLLCAASGLWLTLGSWPTDIYGRYIVIGVTIAISEPVRNVVRIRFARTLRRRSSQASTIPSSQIDEFIEHRLSERLFRTVAVVPAWPISLLLGLLFDFQRDRFEFALTSLNNPSRM